MAYSNGYRAGQIGGSQYLATIISTVGPLLWAKGTRRSTYWYVPEIKGMMKIVHEGMDENGAVTVEETFTLTSFQPAVQRPLSGGKSNVGSAIRRIDEAFHSRGSLDIFHH